MTREEFERQQAVELYKEKAARAGALWNDALKGASKIVAVRTDLIDEPQAVVVSEETEVEIPEIEETVPEDAEVISEIIDYTKLSIEERASLLPVPTDDYTTEYATYCQRMGYTAERMKSIRYKMDVYDEFMAEYQYRKKYHGVSYDSRITSVQKNRETR